MSEMYGVSVKITGVFGDEPFGVFGKYNVAFNSTLSRTGILTAHRRSYSEVCGAGDNVGVGDCATMFVAGTALKAAAKSDDFIFVRLKRAKKRITRLFVVDDDASSHSL